MKMTENYLESPKHFSSRRYRIRHCDPNNMYPDPIGDMSFIIFMRGEWRYPKWHSRVNYVMRNRVKDISNVNSS